MIETNRIKQLKLNLLLGGLISIFTVVRYMVDNTITNAVVLDVSNKIISPLFFISYLLVLFISIKKNNSDNLLDSAFGKNWFIGFKTVVVVTLVSVLVSYIMELLLPNIRTQFFVERQKIVNALTIDVDQRAQQMSKTKSSYFFLKLSFFMFLILFLGALLNTIICVAIKIYCQLIKHKIRV